MGRSVALGREDQKTIEKNSLKGKQETFGESTVAKKKENKTEK